MSNIDDIALFDMDGTLCDYESSLLNELNKLKSPGEPEVSLPIKDDAPEYIKNRRSLVTSFGKWWENLPKFQLGWDVLDIAKEMNYRIVVLTQGPRRNSAAWSGKKRWIDKYLGQDVDLTITRDKGLSYGKLLVDDNPEYISGWVRNRKRGLVIMPANRSNGEFKHSQVIRYDGRNLNHVKVAMSAALKRKSLETVDYQNI